MSERRCSHFPGQTECEWCRNDTKCYRCDSVAEHQDDNGDPLCFDCWTVYRCEQDFPPEDYRNIVTGENDGGEDA